MNPPNYSTLSFSRNKFRIVGTLLLLAGISLGIAIGYQLGHSAKEKSTTPENQSANHSSEIKTLYTCGMHPEVIQDHPGNCPKCGMKLTPMAPDRARTILEARGETVSPTASDNQERKILYWRAPMDPTYIRNEPGKSPMGMDLVPVYEDEVRGGPTIQIDPVTEQNMGLRYDVVRQGPAGTTVRTVATVDYDEDGLGTVTTKVDGWVESVYVSQTGTQVHKGDALFEFYSPQLYSAQEEYLVALSGQKSAGSSDATSLARQRVASARERLSYFDISPDQITALEQDGKIRKTLTIRSQLTGIVTEKKIVEGDFINAGMPAYKIADLSTVWVIGKVFESDLPSIRLGQETHMTLDYLPGRIYRGRVTYIYPYLEKGTREIPVRMEFHNPGYDLKPGMYASIDIKNQLEDQAVLVPDMAVIHTGKQNVAFVMREPGKFEARKLTLGTHTDSNEWQVRSGLVPGEKIVVSGQFLLDSESRLREATLKMLKPGLTNTREILSATPMEGMEMPMSSPTSATKTAVEKYICPMPSHAGILYDHPGDCPLCGMKLVPVQPWNMDQSPVAYYTCPMPEHYDVNEDHPGKCPRCGMTLIPITQNEVNRFQNVPPDKIPETLYTCPMPSHADVVSDQPGKCPKCGMELVPTASVPHGKQAEMKWRENHSKK